MLAAVMVAGSLQGAVVAEASQVKKIKVNTVANATEASAFEFDEDTATITKYLGSDAQVIIPDVIDGNDVETIGEVAFASNEYKRGSYSGRSNYHRRRSVLKLSEFGNRKYSKQDGNH